jgi:mRNA interferase MazF
MRRFPKARGVTGFIMVEQVKSIDLRSRNARRVGRVAAQVLDEVLSILDACMY